MTGKRRRRARSSIMSCMRSEEHTSELQSQSNLVCRLLLEKKYNQVVQLRRDGDATHPPHSRLAIALFSASARQLNVLRLDRIRHVIIRRIEPDQLCVIGLI